ncbi:unnamed protein product [Prorocentrum cordatum]|uniref:ethanolamine-phosphate cytidylyltransferase n=1 Tax=Prorocentrum cordatum TaxID=2364126 RepID=A0ABN9TAF5_9DINO|nr:unnamed protein product [Polarella glacialis]
MDAAPQGQPEPHAGAAAGGGGLRRDLRGLEREWVEVPDEGLRFLWHRPPREEVARQRAEPGTVRIFLNGCFDLMHIGHFNALRQAKSLFQQRGYSKVVMVAGIHSDEAISHQKGPPLMDDDERIAMLQATKWVDEMATSLPYTSMSVKMADALSVDWICHGDDLPVCRSGGGMYTDAIEKGRFQMLKRTEGISTTQILQRLLERPSGDDPEEHPAVPSALAAGSQGTHDGGPPLESALATTQRLAQFAERPGGAQRGCIGDAKRVVYIGGTFDLLHVGHARALEQASELGDYLLVGVHSDETVRRRRGMLPVLTLMERAMAVLAMRWVDDVVLGAPWEVTRDLLVTMNVAVVAAGQQGPLSASSGPLVIPRTLGILREVDSESQLTSGSLRDRFLQRRDSIEKRNGALLPKEATYTRAKEYVFSKPLRADKKEYPHGESMEGQAWQGEVTSLQGGESGKDRAGIAIAMPVLEATGSRWRAMQMAVLSGLAEPLGALVAVTVLPANFVEGRGMDALLCGVGGVMTSVAFTELLPEALAERQPLHVAAGLIAGFAVMMLTHELA